MFSHNRTPPHRWMGIRSSMCAYCGSDPKMIMHAMCVYALVEFIFAPFWYAPFTPFQGIDVWHVSKIISTSRIKNVTSFPFSRVFHLSLSQIQFSIFLPHHRRRIPPAFSFAAASRPYQHQISYSYWCSFPSSAPLLLAVFVVILQVAIYKSNTVYLQRKGFF